jgi:outer membrane protein assembly factor BamB
MKKPAHKPNLRHARTTFYIFPALIPLAELLPWVLSFIGAVAGGSQMARDYMAVHHKFRKAIWAVTAISFIAAAGIYGWEQLRLPSKEDGSELVAMGSYSKVEDFPLSQQHHSRTPTVYAPFRKIWSVTTEEQNLGNMVVENGRLMIGTYDGSFEIRSVFGGAKITTLHKSQPIFTAPAVSDKMVYIGEGLHTADMSALTAFSYLDGKVLWERRFRSHLESTPALDEQNNRLFIGAGAEGLWSLDTKTGKKNWRAPLGHIDVSPLLRDNRLFAAAKLNPDDAVSGSALFEIDVENGGILWKTDLLGNPMGDVLAGPDDTILVSTAIGQVGVNKDTDKGWLYGLNAEGKLLWQRELPAMPLPDGQVLADRSLAFFTLKDGSLIAVKTTSGEIAWAQKLGRGFDADCALIEDGPEPLVVAISLDGAVHVRRAKTGETVGHMDVGKGSYTAPFYKDGVIYVANSFAIHAFAGPKGTVIP